MEQDQKGLTLINSMMLIAIIGILATIAIPPAYQMYEDSQAREQVMEAMSLLDNVKNPVSEFHASNGRWPTEAEFDALVPAENGKYVASLTPLVLASGFQVTAKFRNSGVSPSLVDGGTGRTLVLATAAGQNWICNDSKDPENGVPGIVGGSVLPQHRPAACR
jgi:type IV pilus assembly protein PilA